MRILSLDPKVELPGGGTIRVRAVPTLAGGRYVNLAFLWGRRSRFHPRDWYFFTSSSNHLWVTASVGLRPSQGMGLFRTPLLGLLVSPLRPSFRAEEALPWALSFWRHPRAFVGRLLAPSCAPFWSLLGALLGPRLGPLLRISRRTHWMFLGALWPCLGLPLGSSWALPRAARPWDL